MVTYKGTPIRLLVDFSAETLEATREQNDAVKILKDKNCHPIILYSAKLSFIYKGQIDFPKQTEAEGVHPHQICLKGDVERSSSTRNKMATIYRTLSKVRNRTRKLQLSIKIGFQTLYYSIKVKRRKKTINIAISLGYQTHNIKRGNLRKQHKRRRGKGQLVQVNKGKILSVEKGLF